MNIPIHFPGVKTDGFVVMPNHLHGILHLPDDVGARHGAPIPDATPIPTGIPKPLGTVINLFKGAVTSEARRRRVQQRTLVWQRGYHDHYIRDSEDLSRVRRYIAENPSRWADDAENPKR